MLQYFLKLKLYFHEIFAISAQCVEKNIGLRDRRAGGYVSLQSKSEVGKEISSPKAEDEKA